jgi:triphosphatase
MSDESIERGAGQTRGNRAMAGNTSPPLQEIEIKFRADEKALGAVLGSKLLNGGKFGASRELASVYFDTAEQDLRRNGMTLRLRKKARAIPVLGVKWDNQAADNMFGRGEIEVRCPGAAPHIELFEPAVGERLSAAIGTRALAPVFETRVRRRVAVFHHGLSEIEVSIDQGAVLAGNSSEALSEVELELKSGNPADLIACAAKLAHECSLSLIFEPKAGRGYRLLDRAVPRPQRARPVVIAANASFDDLVTAVIFNTLAHFAANWASLRGSDAPESVHQLRVALRRMRSALGIFRKTVSLPELENIRLEAKRIASALGPARECDAFRQNALAGPFSGQPERLKAAAGLLSAVEARRRDSYAAARRAIDDPSATLFVLDVQAFLVRRAWRTALPPQDLGLLTSPAQPFAAAVLDRLRRRALKRGKHLPDMPDEQRHELRIALKNLRYAAEFFGGLFGDGKELKSFLRLAADLQEDLGAHNDAATAEVFIGSLGLPDDPRVHFASGYLLGYYRHATVIADSHLARKWKDFRRASAFWT